MTRHRIAIILLVTGLGLGLTSCEFLEKCGKCEQVTVHPDGTETRTAPIAFCGNDLEDKQNFIPETVDGTTIYWDCY